MTLLMFLESVTSIKLCSTFCTFIWRSLCMLLSLMSLNCLNHCIRLEAVSTLEFTSEILHRRTMSYVIRYEWVVQLKHYTHSNLTAGRRLLYSSVHFAIVWQIFSENSVLNSCCTIYAFKIKYSRELSYIIYIYLYIYISIIYLNIYIYLAPLN